MAIREELTLKYLLEEKEKDVDYDLADTGAKVTAKMKKTMNAKSDKEFVRMDNIVDQSGNQKEQAGMLAKYALDYTDFDPSDPKGAAGKIADAKKILKLAASQGIATLTAGIDQAQDQKAPADEDPAASGDDFKQAMAQEGLSKNRMSQIIREEVAQYYMTKFLK